MMNMESMLGKKMKRTSQIIGLICIMMLRARLMKIRLDREKVMARVRNRVRIMNQIN
jgi:hypothetical protein